MGPSKMITVLDEKTQCMSLLKVKKKISCSYILIWGKWIYTCHELQFAGGTYPFNHLSSVFVYERGGVSGCVCCLLEQCYPTASAESVSAVFMLCQGETLGRRLLHQPFLLFNSTMQADASGSKAQKVGENREHKKEAALYSYSTTSSHHFVKKLE